MKLYKSNGKISFINSKGDLILSSKNVPEKELQEAFFNNDEEKIMLLILDKEYEQENKVAIENNKMIDEFSILLEKYPNLFEHRNEAYYRKGIDVSLPTSVLKGYLQKGEKNEFSSMDNFWSWLCLCPNEDSRKDLLVFIEKHGLQITKEGIVLAYRRVVSVTDNNEQKLLLDFVSNSYIKVKTKWKKNPANFYIYKDNGKFKLRDTYDALECLGNLKDLYTNLEFVEKQFTDKKTRKEDYRIGVENRMEREQCDQNNKVECSTGYHVGNQSFSYSGFGDTPVLVCFNPRDTIACPYSDAHKLRVCAFTILGVLDKDEEAKVLDNNEYEFQDILDEVSKKHMDELERLLNETELTESIVNNKITKMPLSSMKAVKNSLSLNSNLSSNNYESI